MICNVLYIDLSTGAAEEKKFDAGLWLGGRGMATKLFYDEVDPKCDPLGPDNVMVIAMSPLSGTPAPTAGRTHTVFKSPLTGAIGSSNTGGRWGKIFKSSGYDALVIKGAAKSPVYLTVSDKGETLADRIKIHDASAFWGKQVPEVTDALAAQHGDKSCSVMTIGPAGENKVRIASIMNDHNRAFGRCGPGAVFGSKNLKAIVVSGSKKTPIADPVRFKDVTSQTRHIMKAVPATKNVMHELGTAGLVHLINIMGILPRKNFIDCTHDYDLVEGISGEAIAEKILVKAGACYACPIMCQRHTKVGGKTGEGPEYETVILMGSLIDIYDLEAITVGNYAANELGIDTMSLGGALACAAELFETGALSPADFGGNQVRFGDASIYPSIVDSIAYRDGIGDLIAEGARLMARKAGHPEMAMHVKGLELPAYDPRGMPAQALGYMTSPTGACHLRGGYSVSLAYFAGYKEVPRFSIRQAAVTCKNQQDHGIIEDSLGVCRFTSYAAGTEHWAKAYTSVTGENISREEIEEAAERICTLERIFNNEAGFTRADDDLPTRFKTESIIVEGRERMISDSDRNRMLDDYYQTRGWDRDGVPTKETLEKYEIEI